MRALLSLRVMSVALVTLSVATAASANSVVVDCSGSDPGAFSSIRAALAALDPTVTNTISVAGVCSNEPLRIEGFRQLTITASPVGAVVSQEETTCGTPASPPLGTRSVLQIVDSHQVTIAGVVFRGGQGVMVDDSTGVTFRAATFEKSRGNGLTVNGGSSVSLSGRSGTLPTPNTIQNNCSAGVFIGPTSTTAVSFGATIQDNGIGLGIDGVVTLNAPEAAEPIVVQNHRGPGVRVFGGRFAVNGKVVVQHNGTEPQSLVRAGIWAVAGATVDAGGGGLEVLTNGGPGVWMDINSRILFGPIVDPAAPRTNTISGNGEEGLRLLHLSLAQTFDGTTITGNGGSDLTCDGTSHAFGDVSDVVVNRCANTEQLKKNLR